LLSIIEILFIPQSWLKLTVLVALVEKFIPYKPLCNASMLFTDTSVH